MQGSVFHVVTLLFITYVVMYTGICIILTALILRRNWINNYNVNK